MGGASLWDAGSNKVKEAELSSSIHPALLPDGGYNGTSCHHDGPTLRDKILEL